MNLQKINRFAQADSLACPICQDALTLVEKTLKCPKNHSFDVAKFGYVNLAPHIKQSKDYDKESFENRHLILDQGFYNHVLEVIFDLLQTYPEKREILDIGCGEGFYAQQIQQQMDRQIYAFDISKDSIQLAAKQDTSLAVKWLVADLANLPIQTGSMDILLDIFSPANYQEFKRVLKTDGLLIKVVPNQDHLKEIREKVQEQLLNKDYSNQEIIQHFQEHCQLIKEIPATKTLPLNDQERAALLKMTPLLFHINQEKIDWSDLNEITISATLLIGQFPD